VRKVNEDTKHPDSEPEFEERVFKPGEPVSGDAEPEFAADTGQDLSTETGPDLSPDPDPEPVTGADPDSITETEAVPSADEPVFATGGGLNEAAPAAPLQPPLAEDADDAAFVEPQPVSSYIDAEESESWSPTPPQRPPDQPNWQDIASEAEATDDLLPDKEYDWFDETPAQDVALSPARRRQLGRTGPMWVMSGVVVLVIAGLAWFAVDRLFEPGDSSSQAVALPTAQKVETTPTPDLATATPAVTATPTPVLLPIGANVTVYNTGDEGVRLREEPGRGGGLVIVLQEGTTVLVLEAGPDDLTYPRFEDGFVWYRLRTIPDAGQEPLEGWAASDFFIVE
jgi:hypothetical protein